MTQRYVVPVLMTVAADSPEEATERTSMLMAAAVGVGPFSRRYVPEIGNPQLREELKRPISRDEALSLKLALGSAGVGDGDLFSVREVQAADR